MPKSAIFAKNLGEKLNEGTRSMQEFFLFEQCVKYCVQEGIEVTEDNIFIVYNTVVDVLQTLDDEGNKINVARKQME